jgi:DNA (cytosine-5)-methyltransferase 1
MPHWNVIKQDIRTLELKKYRDKVDIITGGFPCQAFSYAGKKLGLEDIAKEIAKSLVKFLDLL